MLEFGGIRDSNISFFVVKLLKVMDMTFTMQVKEEISNSLKDYLELLPFLSAFVKYSSTIKKNSIVLTMENAHVARVVYKTFKVIFNISPKINVRVQKRFKVKQIYILTINEKVDFILKKLNIVKDGKFILPEVYFLSTDEDILFSTNSLVVIFLTTCSTLTVWLIK